MAQHPPSPPRTFNPDAQATLPTDVPPAQDEVESPCLSSYNVLARFEFEPGHSKEGTKVLMVEWEDDSKTRNIRGEWQLEWEGKTTVLPASDRNNEEVHRMYFLLPPGVAVPPTVTLTHRPTDAALPSIVWRTNPLPAIFPPELGASARAAGKKGVLHTIWAKKRLQVLQREIDAESKLNVEGIALIMALQEKEWIEKNFGVTAKPSSLTLSAATSPSSDSNGALSAAPLSPTSPRTPGGTRLMEKLKGLRLGTSDRDLSGSRQSGPTSNGSEATDLAPSLTAFASNPLSPEVSDVAVSSFAVFKGASPSTLAAKPPQNPAPSLQPLSGELKTVSAAPQPPRRVVAAQAPPPSLVAQQEQMGGMASLNAFAAPTPPSSKLPFALGGNPSVHSPETEDKEEDLFALPISPRSPEMGRSPFSFAAADAAKYRQGERVA